MPTHKVTLTQLMAFRTAVAHLRNGNDRAICAFARTNGHAMATAMLDAIQVRGTFDSRCTSYDGYDYAAQRWLPPIIESNGDEFVRDANGNLTGEIIEH